MLSSSLVYLQGIRLVILKLKLLDNTQRITKGSAYLRQGKCDQIPLLPKVNNLVTTTDGFCQHQVTLVVVLVIC